MRASSLRIAFAIGSALALGALVACGGPPKQAGDTTEVKTTPPDETPKWEGATAPPPDDAKKPTGPGIGANEAPRRRTDVYDKDATESVIKRAARQVKENCGAAKDDNGKASGPWGKATIQLMLGRNGHSKGVTVPAPFQGKPTGNCVEKAFTNLTFPPWGGEDTQIDWEVELVDPSAPPAKK